MSSYWCSLTFPSSNVAVVPTSPLIRWITILSTTYSTFMTIHIFVCTIWLTLQLGREVASKNCSHFAVCRLVVRTSPGFAATSTCCHLIAFLCVFWVINFIVWSRWDPWWGLIDPWVCPFCRCPVLHGVASQSTLDDRHLELLRSWVGLGSEPYRMQQHSSTWDISCCC